MTVFQLTHLRMSAVSRVSPAICNSRLSSLQPYLLYISLCNKLRLLSSRARTPSSRHLRRESSRISRRGQRRSAAATAACLSARCGTPSTIKCASREASLHAVMVQQQQQQQRAPLTRPLRQRGLPSILAPRLVSEVSVGIGAWVAGRVGEPTW